MVDYARALDQARVPAVKASTRSAGSSASGAGPRRRSCKASPAKPGKKSRAAGGDRSRAPPHRDLPPVPILHKAATLGSQLESSPSSNSPAPSTEGGWIS